VLIPGALTSLRGERGFTLIETLVAMVTGVIVTGALFAILEVSMHQSARISDVAQATQLGRTTMTHIIDETHSACISQGFTPVLKESSATKLVFVNGYSEAAEVPSTGVTSSTGIRKDEIVWEKASGYLIDKVAFSTGETAPGEYSWGTAKSVRIGEHISQSVEKSAPLPVFTYYEYGKVAKSSATEGSNTLEEPIELSKLPKEELGTTEAETVGSVLVRFTAAPTDNSTATGRRVDLSSQATFAFSAPNSETPISAGPCE
jgi:type II secretory pathway pseudopilin PulG